MLYFVLTNNDTTTGVHLKDLILLNTALSDKIDDGGINLRKMAQLSVTFEELMQLQNTKAPIEANMDLVNMLRVSCHLLTAFSSNRTNIRTE